MSPLMIPIVLFVMVFSIPIIAMLLQHQQKMTQLINSRADTRPELDAMRHELMDLRNLVNQQALVIDNLDAKVRALPQNQTTVNT